ncbi:PaaX family transcriptional regulator [Actinocrispum wychmicini]|uniref:Phenylacetic acid degradation operon negative regulatory protein n=1 Tax=Actinocrispum wychmicini TaxID=1213861 RepID=A0A4R2JR88_9PSEU|nr:PaaX family transcriptional regulator [Actinocrispum wychmicini]TCO59728.1 phenylacetic acid degradation operon negative regulatory protein [Actinocrispum wychmicini]
MQGIEPRTVIEACFDPNGVASLERVYRVATAVGLRDQPVRLAILRLAAAGVLRQEGHVRKGRLVLTDAGRLRSDTDVRLVAFAAAQDAGRMPWNGLWRLYTFSAPEPRRAERDSLHTALTRLGSAALTPGVYVSPHDLLPELIQATSAETVGSYLIIAEATRLTGPGFTDPESTAERLWPAAETIAAYKPLADLLSGDVLNASTELVATALRLAEAFTQALEHDPLLPLELRSDPWPPVRLRHDFREAWAAIRSRTPDLSLFRTFKLE